MTDNNNLNWDEHSLRIYRARSWLKKANQAHDDDTQFIALWIAFNATYAREIVELSATYKSELGCQLPHY